MTVAGVLGVVDGGCVTWYFPRLMVGALTLDFSDVVSGEAAMAFRVA